MNRKLLLGLVVIFLISACSSSPEYTVSSPQALSIDYQVVGSTKNTFMVVVDPKNNKDREGLLKVSKRLCEEVARCKVWFWDDMTKADTSYPVDPDKEQTLIAVFTSDRYTTYVSELRVFTLGDK